VSAFHPRIQVHDMILTKATCQLHVVSDLPKNWYINSKDGRLEHRRSCVPWASRASRAGAGPIHPRHRRRRRGGAAVPPAPASLQDPGWICSAGNPRPSLRCSPRSGF
jgi:hypothetical protein